MSIGIRAQSQRRFPNYKEILLEEDHYSVNQDCLAAVLSILAILGFK